MTIAPSTRYVKYDPVVLTTTFDVPFPIFDNSDLRVIVDGVETLLYSVTATYVDGRSSDAQVVLTTGVTGVSVEIYGSRSPARTASYLPNSPRLSENLQNDIDLTTAVQQEQARDFGRSIKVPADENPDGMELPSAADRAMHFIGFDANGALVVSQAGPSGTPISAFMETVVASIDAATARALLAAAPLASPTFTGRATIPMTTITAAGADAVGLAAANPAFMIGSAGGNNLLIGTNGTQARNNGAAAAFSFNNLGGNITLGGAGLGQIVTIHSTINSSSEAVATQADATTGTANNLIMTPLRVTNAIDSRMSPDAHFTYESAAVPADFPTGAMAALPVTTSKDNQLGITLSANQMTFTVAGTYYVEAIVTARNASGGGRSAAIRLYNTTAAALEVAGTGFNTSNATVAVCHMCGKFTVAANDVLELQGLASGTLLQIGDETDFNAPNIYSILKFWKVL